MNGKLIAIFLLLLCVLCCCGSFPYSRLAKPVTKATQTPFTVGGADVELIRYHHANSVSLFKSYCDVPWNDIKEASISYYSALDGHDPISYVIEASPTIFIDGTQVSFGTEGKGHALRNNIILSDSEAEPYIKSALELFQNISRAKLSYQLQIKNGTVTPGDFHCEMNP
jgi:hypothetical protein